MSVLRLYADEDASEHAVVHGLRARGVDIMTTSLDSTDGISNKGDDHYGIVVIPDQRYSVGEKIRRIAGLAAVLTADEMVNRMEYL